MKAEQIPDGNDFFASRWSPIPLKLLAIYFCDICAFHVKITMYYIALVVK